MGKKRLNQVSELIRQEMAQIFLREMEFPRECLVTITKVETSEDFEHARIWVSVLPATFAHKVISLLDKDIYHLQKLLNRKLVMHFVPKVRFLIDHSLEKSEKINMLLDNVKDER